jgi:hypothetical protein
MPLNFPNSPTDGQLYTDTNSGNRWVWDSANTVWKSTSTFTQTITVSSTQPGSPVVGQLWWSQDYGRLFVYYNDGNSSQWVEANPADQTAGLVFNTANAAYGTANAGHIVANGAYGRANTALQNTSGTFSGNMYISGTLGVGATVPEKTLEVAVTNNTTNTHYGIKVSNYSFTTDTRASIVFKNADNNGCAIWSRRTGSASGELYFGTNSGAGIDETNIIERMRIDSSGRVITPYQPAFYADTGSSGGWTSYADGNVFVLISAPTNVGTCYSTSTGRFTAPVAGNYYFSACAYMQGSTATGRIGLWKNGSQICLSHKYNTNDGSLFTAAVITLAVNDYVEFRNVSYTINVYMGAQHTYFSGMFLG